MRGYYVRRLLVTSVIAGIIAGLLIGGFYSVFQAPVMERAIALEKERATSVASPHAHVEDEGGPRVSLGAQRIGLVLDTAISGAIFGLFFSVGFALLRRVAPGWPVVCVALTAGVLGFWSLSFFPFIKYPLYPPGVGYEAALLALRSGQVLFMFISVVAVGVALDAFRHINQNIAEFAARGIWYGGVLGVYAILALAMVFAFPGNPDPTPVPIDLLQSFRTLTMTGQLLMWVFLAMGVTLALLWHQWTESNGNSVPTAAAGLAQ